MRLEDTAKLMTSEDYKERFIAEYVQAAIRLKRLGILLSKVKNGEAPSCFTPTCPISLLEYQYKAMIRYCNILVCRAKIEKIALPFTSIDESKSEQ